MCRQLISADEPDGISKESRRMGREKRDGEAGVENDSELTRTGQVNSSAGPARRIEEG